MLLAPAAISDRARNRGTAEHPSLWDGLQAVWAFDLLANSLWQDLAGSNDVAAVTSNATWVRPYVEFDGNDSIGNTSPAISAEYPFSVVAYVQTDSAASNGTVVSLVNATDRYMALQVRAGKAVAVARNNTFSDSLNAIGSTTLATGRWYSLCAVYESATSRSVYVDGILDGASSGAVSEISSVASVRMGELRGSGTDYFDGRMLTASIYGRALNLREIVLHAVNPLAPIRPRRRLSVLVPELGGGGVTITPASCTHGHTADAPVVTQTHQITAADATHSQTVDSPAISQTHVVAVAEAAHAHAADSPAVTQTHVVAAADATHGHTADTVTVTVDAVSVTPADATHGHTADSASVTQTHVIVVADATHNHTADSPAITQTHVVSVASAIHSHTADNVTVTLSAAVAASQFWVCIGLEGWFSDRVGIEGWLAEALGLEAHLATAKGIE